MNSLDSTPARVASVLAILLFGLCSIPAQATSFKEIARWPHGLPATYDDVMRVAWDPDGFLYLTAGVEVRKYTTAGALVTQWGSPGFGPGEFSLAWDVAVDSHHDVYVADRYNHRIEKFSPTGQLVTQWQAANWQGGTHDEALGVTVSPADEVFVAVGGMDAVMRFTRHGQFIEYDTVAGLVAHVSSDGKGIVYRSDRFTDVCGYIPITGAPWEFAGCHALPENEGGTPATVEQLRADAQGSVWVVDNLARFLEYPAPSFVPIPHPEIPISGGLAIANDGTLYVVSDAHVVVYAPIATANERTSWGQLKHRFH